MDEATTKPWWQSVGVWGSVVTIMASVAGLLGYSITPEDQLVIVSGLNKAAMIVTETVAFVGGLAALWGRIRASKLIG